MAGICPCGRFVWDKKAGQWRDAVTGKLVSDMICPVCASKLLDGGKISKVIEGRGQ